VSAKYDVRCLSGGSVTVTIDGTELGTVAEGASSTYEKSYTPGWHILKTSFASAGGDVALGRSPMSERDDGTFSSDMLWKGVAVHGFSIGEGAQLHLGADQAMAIGAASSPSFLAGVVFGESGSRLALLGGSIGRVGLRGLKSHFTGTLEVGRMVDVLLEAGQVPSCSIAGKGTVHVVSGCENLFGADFGGRIDIPEGVTFTAPSALRDFVATGNGALVLTHADQIGAEAGFLGQVTLPVNATVSADSLAPMSKGVLLSDGGVLSVGERSIAYAGGAYDALDGFSAAGAWSLLGSGESSLTLKDGSKVTFPVNKAYVDGAGALVLTDGAGQHHAAMLKSRGFSRADDWSCGFDWSATLPADSAYAKAGNGQALAEGTAFILQPSTNGYHTYSSSAAPLGSYGFYVSTYNAAGPNAGVRWVDNGFVDTYPNVPEGTGGITVTKPIHFEVVCRGGVLFVTMRQEGKSYSFTRDVGKVFEQDKPVYLGFSAGTSWWGSSSTVPWSLQTVADFSGRVARPDAMTAVDSTLGNLKDAQWTTSGNTYRDVNGGVVRLVSTASKTGFLLNKTPFPTHRPFTLKFTATCSEFSGTGAEGFSCAFQQTGTSVTHPGGTSYYLKDIPSCGFIYYVYSRAIAWVQDGDKVDPMNNVVDMTSGVENVCTLVYDGNGGMELTVTSANKTYTARRYYPEMLAWGDDMYLTFVAATASWTWCKIGLKEMSVTRPQAAGGTVAVPVSVGTVADAQARVWSEFADTSVRMDDVALAEGSKLTFGAAQGASAYAISNVSLDGESTLAAAGSARLAVGPRIVYETPAVCTLHLEGSQTLADALQLVGRSTWRGRSARGLLLDYSGLSAGSVRPKAYSVRDENGEDLLAARRFVLAVRPTGVYAAPGGLAILIR